MDSIWEDEQVYKPGELMVKAILLIEESESSIDYFSNSADELITKFNKTYSDMPSDYTKVLFSFDARYKLVTDSEIKIRMIKKSFLLHKSLLEKDIEKTMTNNMTEKELLKNSKKLSMIVENLRNEVLVFEIVTLQIIRFMKRVTVIEIEKSNERYIKKRKKEKIVKLKYKEKEKEVSNITSIIITTGVIILFISIIIGVLGVRKDLKNTNEIKESTTASNKQLIFTTKQYHNSSIDNNDSGLSDYETFTMRNELKEMRNKQLSDLKEELAEESTIKAVIDNGILYMIKCTYTNEADFILEFIDKESHIEKELGGGVVNGEFDNVFSWYRVHQ